MRVGLSRRRHTGPHFTTPGSVKRALRSTGVRSPHLHECVANPPPVLDLLAIAALITFKSPPRGYHLSLVSMQLQESACIIMHLRCLHESLHVLFGREVFELL